MSYSPSFWEQDSLLQPYELIIVGAGIVGLSTAFFYKQSNPDAKVMVLERGFLPQGASTRNAGFACIGSISEHLADLQKESEEKVKERILRRYRGLELLKRTLGEDAMGYRDCGGYEFFKSREKFEEIAAEIERFNGWLEELIGQNGVYDEAEIAGTPVILNRLEGALHPGMMIQSLVQKVSSMGVDIKWNSLVKKVEPTGQVQVSGGPVLQAENIVIAANGFVQKLLPHLEIVPARGLVFVTNEQEELPWKGIFHHDEGYIYFRNVGSRLLIGGARNLDAEGEQTDEFGTNTKIKESLVNFVNDELKLPNGWRIEREWSGIMGFTPTKTPVIERLDEHRYVAAGLSGMGIAIGMEVGKGVAEKL
jgi:glycine/D-amino acid oxidase-like deaminating enzyme